ncbi:MAG: bacterioferritin [Deltaproteobacteria bacterium]|nr:bacterioferritin [Deltaproteobacteria bacterium]
MPKGQKKVIDCLNESLSAELTGINQYVVHAEMCGNWGYDRLHDLREKDAIEEMKHAEALIGRILYLEGVPNVQKLGKINIGETVEEQLKADLDLEYGAVAHYNKGVALCAELNDNGSRELLEKILKDEEKHVDWLEAQRDQIAQVGLQNYLAQQIVGDKA